PATPTRIRRKDERDHDHRCDSYPKSVFRLKKADLVVHAQDARDNAECSGYKRQKGQPLDENICHLRRFRRVEVECTQHRLARALNGFNGILKMIFKSLIQLKRIRFCYLLKIRPEKAVDQLSMRDQPPTQLGSVAA